MTLSPVHPVHPLSPMHPVRLASRLAALRGWRRLGLAFGLGALAMLGLPPFGLVPVLALAFTGLVWLLDGVDTPRRAFWTGWAFGFGHLVVGLYWIALALLVEADRFAWLLPFAVIVLPGLLALFYALAIMAAHRFWRPGGARVAILALAWLAAEWLRGHVLTGFPWNVTGYAWTDLAAPRQAAALVGVWGLSLGTVLLAALPATLADAGRQGWHRLRPTLGGLAVLALVCLGGWVRLGLVPAPDPAATDRPLLRIVQGNIDQHIKWSAEARRDIFERYLNLSQAPSARPLAAVIWPETATPYLIDILPENAAAVARAAPHGGVLLTGAMRVREGQVGQPDEFQAWNSLVALAETGAILGIYDKAHLVPFGEYLPLRPMLSRFGIDKLAQGAVDFSAGPGPRTLHIAGLPAFSPLICYEVIFPAAVADQADRPEWLLNLTNDAWFGKSIGPYQHLAMARMRAVEQGVPLVRAANTGISVVFDSVGRDLGHLNLGETGILDINLPEARSGITPYARLGDWIVLGIAAVIGIFLGRLKSS